MKFWFLSFVVLLAACATSTTAPSPEKVSLQPVEFTELPGWQSDKISEVIPALKQSCSAGARRHGIAGKPADWAIPCAIAAALPPGNNDLTRAFFERWFQAYSVTDHDGLFTGYYEAELRGSWHRHGKYQTPLYARPHDLITVNLGDFSQDLKGKHIAGKVQGNRLVPYDDRKAIAKGSLKKRAHVLLWVDDPVDAFFLAVQGSGRVRMTDDKIVRIGYAGANGRAYVAIGRMMAERGDVPKPVSMQSIRTWLNEHPDHANDTMNENPSYVFFRILKTDGPIGAEGVPLTPMRSLAVDPAYIPLGVPLWLDTVTSSGAPLQRLMMAQDTGGAIKGAVRGDLFWGFGADAEQGAGAMQNPGRYYILLPKTVTPDAQ